MASSNSLPKFTVPGLTPADGGKVAAILQQRLYALNDLHLTLKHVHWNVVGPHFIAVHEMLDPQIDIIRDDADEVAERIATLGSDVKGTPGALVAARDWEDYSIGRADAVAHLGALDVVYQGVISDHRKAADDIEELDPVTNDLLIGQLHKIEQFHWFVRAHLENAGGRLATQGDSSEADAAAHGAAASEKSAAV